MLREEVDNTALRDVGPMVFPNTRSRQGVLPLVVSPAPRASWQTLMKNDPEALPSQSPEWLDCLCLLKGYQDVSRFYEFADGQQLLLPLVRRKGVPSFLSVQASMPHAWGMGGILAKLEPTAEHFAAVFADLAKTPFLSLNMLPNPRQGALWEVACPPHALRIPRRAHVLDLEGGFETVWKTRFSNKTRTTVRKAERSGVVVEHDTTGRLMPVFYELYRCSIDRWAQYQHEPRWLAHLRAAQRDPLPKLQHIAKHLGDTCKVWVAWYEGVPVAASIVLVRENADDIMAAIDKERAAPVNANALLQKLSIEDACEAGCRYYHMGESGDSQGISHFKERFGAQAYPYHEYRLERLPLTKLDRGVRGVVKRAIGFRDA
jgi:hypothetical protein